jgi:hypothetical protein
MTPSAPVSRCPRALAASGIGTERTFRDCGRESAVGGKADFVHSAPTPLRVCRNTRSGSHWDRPDNAVER